MWKRKKSVVEWMLERLETVVVFGSLCWAAIWVGWKSRERRLAPSGPPDLEDPDGGMAFERARRRRHID